MWVCLQICAVLYMERRSAITRVNERYRVAGCANCSCGRFVWGCARIPLNLSPWLNKTAIPVPLPVTENNKQAVQI